MELYVLTNVYFLLFLLFFETGTCYYSPNWPQTHNPPILASQVPPGLALSSISIAII
jgi:hypothetical protein